MITEWLEEVLGMIIVFINLILVIVSLAYSSVKSH